MFDITKIHTMAFLFKKKKFALKFTMIFTCFKKGKNIINLQLDFVHSRKKWGKYVIF